MKADALCTEEKVKHTPGPWKARGPRYSEEARCGHKDCKEHKREMTGYEIRGGTDSKHPGSDLWVADIHGEHVGVPVTEANANARLIAAAPDLLYALQCVRDDIHGEGEIMARTLQLISKSLAKAESP